MPNPEIDLLSIARGSVTAPAGCGKTHLIAQSLARYTGARPILVLTHTNAGVAALRGRFEAIGIAAKAYRLATIDGWSMKAVSIFPVRSGLDPSVLKVEAPTRDYPAIREAAVRLLASGALDEALRSTYAHLIVDEYQDCSVLQHSLIYYLSFVLSTCVLGDPMQAIFGFKGNPLIEWKAVQAHFVEAGTLSTPWRWRNAGSEPFGQWLLGVRESLRTGIAVDLRNAPENVTWLPIDANNPHPSKLKAAQTNAPTRDGRVLVICDSTNKSGQQELASQTPGAVTAEAVDMADLLKFARNFSLGTPAVALQQLLGFAQSVMTNCGIAELNRRLDTLTRGTARTPASPIEAAALTFASNASYAAGMELLCAMRDGADVRLFRPYIFFAALAALRSAAHGGVSLLEAFSHVREEGRLVGRPLPRKAIGSTLLFKGLEAEVGVVIDARNLDAKNLYVAMTRGSLALVVCNPTPLLNPARVD
jgi:hypothetical protein